MEQLAKSIPFARNTLVTFGRKYFRYDSDPNKNDRSDTLPNNR